MCRHLLINPWLGSKTGKTHTHTSDFTLCMHYVSVMNITHTCVTCFMTQELMVTFQLSWLADPHVLVILDWILSKRSRCHIKYVSHLHGEGRAVRFCNTLLNCKRSKNELVHFWNKIRMLHRAERDGEEKKNKDKNILDVHNWNEGRKEGSHCGWEFHCYHNQQKKWCDDKKRVRSEKGKKDARRAEKGGRRKQSKGDKSTERL